MRAMMVLAFVAVALAGPAQANDCEAKASQIVAKLGATIERHDSWDITLRHPAQIFASGTNAVDHYPSYRSGVLLPY
jgi:hypothetical protein